MKLKLFANDTKQMTFILVTMFLNFLGFSVIIPILPFLVQRYTVDPHEIALHVGLIMSAYALCQFFAAPGLGALSDRYGRRPILLVSLFGSVIGYIIMGIGGALWMLFLGRIIDGLTGGNISTVYAYIADITKPHERGKAYGILGAAGGFGFMFGPALGGFLGQISLTTPLYVAAGITFLNMLWGYYALPESLSKEHKSEKINLRHLNPFSQFRHIFSIGILRRIFFFGFLYFIAIFAMYGNTAVYMKDVFSWDPHRIGFLLFTVGLVDIFSQGFLVRKLLPKFGETKIAIAGLVFAVLGFALLSLTAFIVSTVLFYAAVITLNIGDGLFEPAESVLVSNAVGPKVQGRVQGANQGMQSIARIIGPLFSAWVYQFWAGLPYASEAFFSLMAIFVLLASLSIIKNHKLAADAA